MTNLTDILTEVDKKSFNEEWLSINNITNIFIVASYNVENVNAILAELEIKPIFIDENIKDHLIYNEVTIHMITFIFNRILYSFSEEDAEKIRMLMRIYDNE